MKPLLQVEDLGKTFHARHGMVRAADDVSFEIGVRETVALVGESGCGKSTVALSLLRLLEPDSGRVRFEDVELDLLDRKGLRALRRRLSIVFQNPYSSLNPRMRVRDIVGEPLRTAFSLRGTELAERVAALLTDVGLAAEHGRRFPHEFSGGQRQRIAIARALALRPRLLILDEPTSALDVSVQAQVLQLLHRLQAEFDLSYLLIAHNLAVVDAMADRVLVMYLGRIVEQGPTRSVLHTPAHPYTRALLDAVPVLDGEGRARIRAPRGEVPSLLERAPGCTYAPRCPRADALCRGQRPTLRMVGGIRVACHHPLIEEQSA